ncbi:MAG: hypothetical protein ACLFRY_15390 [Spirochaetia bacterium]
MNTDAHPDLVLFGKLDKILADSSSLIYMKKAGFLDRFLTSLEVYTVPEVIAETGFEDLAVKIIHHRYHEERRDRALDTDSILLRCAVDEELPVVSEDRKILLSAEEQGLPYFNALMMLNFLFFKRKITLGEHTRFFRRLLETARYTRRILTYSRELFLEIRKGL